MADMETWLRPMRSEVLWNCVPASKSLGRGFGGFRNAKKVAGVRVCCWSIMNLRDIEKASDGPGCEE